MRFKRVELSPANKRQYLLALGRRDIELLLGEAENAYEHLPRTADFRKDRQRLKGILNGLKEALDVANAGGDDGERVPIDFRQEYKDAREANPMLDITRFEVIDHSKDLEEGGGRTVIFWNEDKVIESSVQDKGRTLKIFIDKREKKET